MFLTNVRMTTLVLAVSVALASCGWLMYRALADPPAVQAQDQLKPKTADRHADSSTQPIPPEKFAILHTLFKPQPDEMKWRQIPWLTSLTEARKKAAAEGKPLYVMSINGTWDGQC